MATSAGLTPPHGQIPWVRDYTVPPVVVKTEIRDDYEGSYTAYIYSDGHVETSPAGRPTFKEDAQRKLLAQRAIADAPRFLKIARGSEAQSERPQLQADNRRAANTRVVAPAFHDTLAGQAAVTATLAASPAYRRSLVNSIDLGGKVVGPRAGKRPEYGGDLMVDDNGVNPPTGLR